MKYMVPEINISRFSLENIVTESAIGQASTALATAQQAVTGATAVTVKTTMEDWIVQ